MQIHFHSLLLSYLPRVPIFLATTVHNKIINLFIEIDLYFSYKNVNGKGHSIII